MLLLLLVPVSRSRLLVVEVLLLPGCSIQPPLLLQVQRRRLSARLAHTPSHTCTACVQQHMVTTEGHSSTLYFKDIHL
jgi:hypothetical protein